MDRLSMLKNFAASKPEDPFPLYGLALEYKKLGRLDDARKIFEQLIDRHPDYVASYLMAGQLLVQLGDRVAARQTFERGIAVAEAAKDEHTLQELQAAKAEISE